MASSPENTQNKQPEQENTPYAPSVEMQQDADRGINLYSLDDGAETPNIDARIATSLVDSDKAVVTDTTYGLAGDKLFKSEGLTAENIAKNKPEDIVKRLAKDMEKGAKAPVLVKTPIGYAFRSNANDPETATAIAVLNEDVNEDNFLLGSNEMPVGIYTPADGDVLVMTSKAVANELCKHPGLEGYNNKIDDLHEHNVSYITIETPQALTDSMWEKRESNDKVRKDNLVQSRIRQSNAKHAKDSEQPSVQAARRPSPADMPKQKGAVAQPSEYDKVTLIDTEAMKQLTESNEEQLSPEDTQKQKRLARQAAIESSLTQYEASAIKHMAERRKGKLAGTKNDDKQTIEVTRVLTEDGKQVEKKETLSYNELVQKIEGLSFRYDMVTRNILRDEGLSDADIAWEIESQQRERAINREDEIHKAMVSSRLDKAMEKYANMPRKKRIAIGLGVAAGLALGGGLIAGAAGGVGAVAGVGAVKAGKAYLQRQSKVYERKEGKSVAGIAEDENRDSFEEKLKSADESARNRMRYSRRIGLGNKFEHDARREEIKRSDRNKRIAVGLGAASALLIGGGLAARAAEWGNIDIRNPFGGDVREPEPIITQMPGEQFTKPDLFDIEDTEERHKLDTDYPTGEEADPLAGTGPAPWEQTATAEAPSYETGDYTAPAETIAVGEGWSSTFNELGITNPADQAALLADDTLMNQLQDRGLAYYDTNIGGWGISMTPDAVMPESALDLISEHAQDLQPDLADLDAESAAFVESLDGTDAAEIDRGEGWLQTFAELGITNPNQQYALLNNYPMMKELEGLGIAYQYGDSWRMNMTSTGQMPHDALAVVAKYAQSAGYDLAA